MAAANAQSPDDAAIRAVVEHALNLERTLPIEASKVQSASEIVSFRQSANDQLAQVYRGKALQRWMSIIDMNTATNVGTEDESGITSSRFEALKISPSEATADIAVTAWDNWTSIGESSYVVHLHLIKLSDLWLIDAEAIDIAPGSEPG
jgi:hypothetical protein